MPLVLVVEDNPDAQEITVETLRHEGYEVMKADGIGDAVATAARRRPDIVVLDCRLPDGDGLELAAKWRKEAAMADVPVVVLTAFSARQDVEAALLAGANAFLVKPCATSVLVHQIEKALATTPTIQKL